MLYTACHWLKHFIYVVVNSEDLRDPEALEKLAGVKRFDDHEFIGHVVLVWASPKIRAPPRDSS
ncbi:MAG: hypothetical protein K2X81_12960 [Candidatus Obscuribacterales bacterium]|nr:hypothetical protein [Candidatus Obscuribacterales bacterium]